MDKTELPESISRTFKVESGLGSGGSGAVYKAWHPRLRKHVVIKELKHSSFSDMEARRNEAEALKNVKSEYLPRVFDFLTEEDRTFTVMDFIEGESFDKIQTRGHGFTGAQVVKWYGQLSSALQAIHRQNVCHRDIKPANIMLTPGGDVCLIDFNAALVGGNGLRLVSRSLGYASPEQYEIFEQTERVRERAREAVSNAAADTGENPDTMLLEGDSVTELTDARECFFSCDPVAGMQNPASEMLNMTESQRSIDWKRSDIYSLGATMYHLLTGKRPPQKAEELASVFHTGRGGDDIMRIIERSMRRNPAERFATAAELSFAISNIGNARQRQKPARAIIAVTILSSAMLVFFLRRKKNACDASVLYSGYEI